MPPRDTSVERSYLNIEDGAEMAQSYDLARLTPANLLYPDSAA
jgi:hypothetical protein